jgi:hypothetical protein
VAAPHFGVARSGECWGGFGTWVGMFSSAVSALEALTREGPI